MALICGICGTGFLGCVGFVFVWWCSGLFVCLVASLLVGVFTVVLVVAGLSAYLLFLECGACVFRVCFLDACIVVSGF